MVVTSLDNIIRRSKKTTRPFLRAIDEAKSAEVDEYSPVCQSFKRRKDGIECRFPDKIRVLELLVKLQRLIRETPAQNTSPSPVAESGAYLPMRLLLEIQEKRRKAVEARYSAICPAALVFTHWYAKNPAKKAKNYPFLQLFTYPKIFQISYKCHTVSNKQSNGRKK